MQGTIVNFRMARHHQNDMQMIILANGISKKDKAKELIGKTAVWKSPAGKEIKGKVTALHGNKAALRVLFEKGMPGQAIGQKIEIL